MKMEHSICVVLVTGPEGVGKSTTIHVLSGILKKHGYKVISPYIRSTFLPIRILRRIFILLGRKQILRKPDGSLHIQPDNNILHRMSCLWHIIDDLCVFTYLLALVLYVKILIRVFSKRVIVICERFIIDTIIDQLYIKILYKPSHKVTELSLYLLIKLLVYVSLKHNFIVIMLDADIDEIIRRLCMRRYSDFIEFVYFQKRLLPKVIELLSRVNATHISTYIDNTHLRPKDTVMKTLYILKNWGCL